MVTGGSFREALDGTALESREERNKLRDWVIHNVTYTPALAHKLQVWALFDDQETTLESPAGCQSLWETEGVLPGRRDAGRLL